MPEEIFLLYMRVILVIHLPLHFLILSPTAGRGSSGGGGGGGGG